MVNAIHQYKNSNYQLYIFFPTHPDLQLDSLVIAEDRLNLEVNAYGADKGRGEGVVRIAEQKWSFSYTAVANN